MPVSLLRAFAAALSALLVPAALAATFLGVEVPPPLPAKNVVDTYWGTDVDDPYRFLENTRDPAVQAWMKSQAEATQAILGKLPVREELRARIAEIDDAVPNSVSSLRRMPSGGYFFLRRNAGEDQFKLVRRVSLGGEDKVLVDPDAIARATGKPHAIGGFTPSPDGKLLAYAISAGGGEIGTMHVIDVESGKEVTPAFEAIRGSAGVAWLEDASGFFYTRLKRNWASLPATERFLDNLRYFHRLGATGEDPAVFGAGVNPDVPVPRSASGYVTPVKGTPYAVAVVRDGVKRDETLYIARLADVLAGKAKWRRVFGDDARITATTTAGGWVYVKTATEAPRYRVLRMPLSDPDLAKAQVVIPASDDVVVEMGAAKDALYVTLRRGPVTRLVRVPHGGEPKVEPIALPFEGNANITSTSHDQEGVIFRLGGWTRASRLHAYEPAGRSVALLPFERPGKFDSPEGLAAREVRVKSHDGVEVPISIISRADVKLDGRNPTILYGYGAYGTTESPAWSPRRLAWFERGGVFVIAHVRGGGVFGDAWHSAGMKTTKANTWKDGIAAAEWLIKEGYTSPDRLAVYGGSAGGIFVGRAMTERPDLFAAAIISVGNSDLVRSETRANGVANIPEYGTVKKEDEFRALLQMSPYAQTRDGVKYPAALFEHGVNDIRVDVWMTLKMASRLAAATASGKPVLQRLEYDGGHGVGATRSQSRERTADNWAFLLWQFGLAKPAD